MGTQEIVFEATTWIGDSLIWKESLTYKIPFQVDSNQL